MTNAWRTEADIEVEAEERPNEDEIQALLDEEDAS